MRAQKLHSSPIDLTQGPFCDTFPPVMDARVLSSSCIQEALTTRFVGRPTYHWPTIGSTMDQAHRLAKEGAPEGTVVTADEQTEGRGRWRRAWWAPPRSSLLLSLVLRPPLRPCQAQRLTMVCSLAVCEAIAEVSGLRAHVKWPNDVLIGERKVCGILTELDVLKDCIQYVVVGIGINVNVDFSHAPPFMAPATSLSIEAGHPVSSLDLLIALLCDIERRYVALLEGHSFHREWAHHMATLGRHVQVSNGSKQWDGLAVGVDQDGALSVRVEDGSVQRVLAGDVTLCSPEDYPARLRECRTDPQ